ncbi:MAG: 50S ribosomal protein L25 [Desulfobacterales bacterium]
MSERYNLVAETRSLDGKKAKQLRRNGLIPAVIYGQREPLLIQIDNTSLRRALRTVGTSNLLELSIGEDTRTVLTREIQMHVTRGDLIHVDFYEVDMKETIKTEADLVKIGTAAPEAEGLGVATLALRSVEIECLPDALVSEIQVEMNLIVNTDDVLYVSDLAAPEGVTILTNPATTVARFEFTREEEEEEELEEDLMAPAADAVEVIGRDKEEEFED